MTTQPARPQPSTDQTGAGVAGAQSPGGHIPSTEMRPATAAVVATRWARAPRAIVTAACIGLVVVQLVWLMRWSGDILGRASLTKDYAVYYQQWYLIAHGNLLPRDTIQGGYVFIRNDGELIVYLLAPLYWVFPNHQLGYLWLQDLAIVGVSATCLRLVVEELPWGTSAKWREQLIAGAARVLVVVLLVANPFVYWTASFDIHMEVFGACFAMLALRAALQRRRSAVVWALLTALCGTASLFYVVGIGVAVTVVFVWRSRGELSHSLPATLRPLWLSAVAVAWIVVLGALHATKGSPNYSYVAGTAAGTVPSAGRVLLGVLGHLPRAFLVVQSHGWNLWAATSPDGLVGLLSPALFVVALPLVTNNLLQAQVFSYPGFQSFLVYGATALGSVAVVVALLRRRYVWTVGAALALAMVLNAAGWFDAWFGASTTDWVRLSAGSAAVVERVASEARAGDEVVASQGFVGVFAARSQVYGFFGTNAVPVRSRTVWFVFSFTEGIETATPTQTIEAIDTVSRLAGVETLEVDDNGIYVYRWNPPGDVSSIVLGAPGTQTALGPVVVALGEPRRPALGTITRKPSSSFAGGVDFYVPAGSYVATVRLQGRGPVLVRVWNESSGREVGSAVVRRAGTEDVRIPFGALIDLPVSLGILRGSGLFRYVAIAPTLHYDVTIRVVVQSTAEVRASWTSVSPVVKL